MQPGIQALIFADKFLQWDDYLIDNIACDFDKITKIGFLKLSFLKYAFGMTFSETLENSFDRDSFKTYIGFNIKPTSLSLRDRQLLEYFVSPFGNLGELIELIDQVLAEHSIRLERKKGSSGFKLMPFLTQKTDLVANDFLDKKIAIWL